MNPIPDPSQEEEDDVHTIKLRGSTTDNLDTIYSNHFLVTFTGTEFYLMFGEAVPPALVNDKDSVPEFIDIKPMARLAVSPATMLKIADAIDRTVKNALGRQPKFGDES